MCQGLGPKKHDEISEIDRRHSYSLIAGRNHGNTSNNNNDNSDNNSNR